MLDSQSSVSLFETTFLLFRMLYGHFLLSSTPEFTHPCKREPSDSHYRPGAQWLLIIISGPEGLMSGINSQYMGDDGMAGLKLPKLCVWPVLTTEVTRNWRLIIMSRTDTKPMQNNCQKCADNESTSADHPRWCKVPSRLVLIRLIGVFNHNFAHGLATTAKM